MDCDRPAGRCCLLSAFQLSSFAVLHLIPPFPFSIMAPQYSPPPDNSYDPIEPQPHPYLHEPILHISSLPHYVTDENLAIAFTTCAPFRPRITRDGSTNPLSGTIQFKVLHKGLQSSAQILHCPTADRCASRCVLFSRNGACHPPRTPDSRALTACRSRALSLSPNHAPHTPSTAKRVSAPREAPSAELHRSSAF